MSLRNIASDCDILRVARFPGNFMFQLTHEEKDKVVANCDYLIFPYRFYMWIIKIFN